MREGWGAWRGKPIIVQITGRLWIFYQTSSAALSFIFFLSLSISVSVPVPKLNSNSQQLYWHDRKTFAMDSICCLVSSLECMWLTTEDGCWNVSDNTDWHFANMPSASLCVWVIVTDRQSHYLICIVMLPLCIKRFCVLDNWITVYSFSMSGFRF